MLCSAAPQPTRGSAGGASRCHTQTPWSRLRAASMPSHLDRFEMKLLKAYLPPPATPGPLWGAASRSLSFPQCLRSGGDLSLCLAAASARTPITEQ